MRHVWQTESCQENIVALAQILSNVSRGGEQLFVQRLQSLGKTQGATKESLCSADLDQKVILRYYYY